MLRSLTAVAAILAASTAGAADVNVRVEDLRQRQTGATASVQILDLGALHSTAPGDTRRITVDAARIRQIQDGGTGNLMIMEAGVNALPNGGPSSITVHMRDLTQVQVGTDVPNIVRIGVVR